MLPFSTIFRLEQAASSVRRKWSLVGERSRNQFRSLWKLCLQLTILLGSNHGAHPYTILRYESMYHMVKLTLIDCHIFLFLLARQAQLRSMLSSSPGRFLIVLIRWVSESGRYPRQLQGFPTPGLANYQATGGPLVLLWSAREHQLRYSQKFRQSLVNLLEGYVSKRLLKLLNKTAYWLYSFVNWSICSLHCSNPAGLWSRQLTRFRWI